MRFLHFLLQKYYETKKYPKSETEKPTKPIESKDSLG